MGREVSTFLDSMRETLAGEYGGVDWRLATPSPGDLEEPQFSVIGTINVDDTEEIEDSGRDRYTGAWYLDLPVVLNLYFSRGVFEDYAIPRDFAFTIAAWCRKRLAGTPSQAVSRVGTIIRQTEITQFIEGGVDSGVLCDWLMWQVRLVVPQAILPEFPGIPGLPDDVFANRQGPAPEETYRFDEAFWSGDPKETDPAKAHQIIP